MLYNQDFTQQVNELKNSICNADKLNLIQHCDCEEK